jgi:hypothetical protein
VDCMLRLACDFLFLSVYLRKEEASSETSCILLVVTMEKILTEVCEVSENKPLSRTTVLQLFTQLKSVQGQYPLLAFLLV